MPFAVAEDAAALGAEPDLSVKLPVIRLGGGRWRHQTIKQTECCIVLGLVSKWMQLSRSHVGAS